MCLAGRASMRTRLGVWVHDAGQCMSSPPPRFARWPRAVDACLAPLRRGCARAGCARSLPRTLSRAGGTVPQRNRKVLPLHRNSAHAREGSQGVVREAGRWMHAGLDNRADAVGVVTGQVSGRAWWSISCTAGCAGARGSCACRPIMHAKGQELGHVRHPHQGQGQGRGCGVVPLLPLEQQHLGVPPYGVAPLQARAFALGPYGAVPLRDWLVPPSRQLTRRRHRGGATSSSKQPRVPGPHLPRAPTSPFAGHERYIGTACPLGPLSRGFRGISSVASLPPVFHDPACPTSLCPTANGNAGLSGKGRWRESRSSYRAATPALGQAGASVPTAQRPMIHGRKGCEIRERCGFGFETGSQSPEDAQNGLIGRE